MVTLTNGFAHGSPPMGNSFVAFHCTRFIPDYLFTHTTGQLGSAIPFNRAMLRLPIVTTTDVFVSRGVLEFLTEISVVAVLCHGFIAFQHASRPGMLTALVQLWIVAVGILNALIKSFFASSQRIREALTSNVTPEICSARSLCPAQ